MGRMAQEPGNRNGGVGHTFVRGDGIDPAYGRNYYAGLQLAF